MSLMLGVATADITPPVGIVLAGYRDRVSTSIGHRLRAEALVCGSGRSRWALVIVETLGFPATFVAEVRREIARRTGIPARRILLAATHTHSGPSTHESTYRRGGNEARYRTRLRATLARVVADAAAAAAPGTLEAAVCEAPEWGHNRRVRKPDGTWGNEWQDVERRHRGYFDPSIVLLGVRRLDGRLEALLANFGSHPVTLGPQSLAISGDYVSYLKDALERSGAVGTALFGLGGHANINPPVCIRRSPRHARAMGSALAKIIGAALPRLRPVSGRTVSAALLPWRLRRAGPAPEGKGLRSGWQRSEVMALRVGDAAIVSVPGELFSEYVAWIRRSSPCAHTVVLSLGNDYIGYFPTDRAEDEGAYEARMAPMKRVERPLQRLVAQALAATG